MIKSTPTNRFWSSRRLQVFGIMALVIYVVISTATAFKISGPSTHPSRELFPFFTWSLFSRISDVRTEYRILVLSIDDQIFDEPVDMRAIDAMPSFSDSRALGYKALQNLGRGLRLAQEGVDSQRRQFEDRYFGKHDMDYIVMHHVYNPLHRWHEGRETDRVRVIGRYHYVSQS